jgi:hypothetical protein
VSCDDYDFDYEDNHKLPTMKWLAIRLAPHMEKKKKTNKRERLPWRGQRGRARCRCAALPVLC